MSNPRIIKRVGTAAFAFQFYARDFFEAYKKHKVGPRFSPARLFLLTRSIELAAKGLHLGQGRTHKDVFALKHDLEATCQPQILATYGISLEPAEEAELKKANEYYKRKGFEYFLYSLPGVPVDRSGPQQALSGWPALPDESILESLLCRLLEPSL
jgi:hypothetical protein